MAVDLNEQFAGNLVAIGQQGVSNNQQVAHLTQTKAMLQAFSVDFMEAASGRLLVGGYDPSHFAGLTASDRVPVVKGS